MALDCSPLRKNNSALGIFQVPSCSSYVPSCSMYVPSCPTYVPSCRHASLCLSPFGGIAFGGRPFRWVWRAGRVLVCVQQKGAVPRVRYSPLGLWSVGVGWLILIQAQRDFEAVDVGTEGAYTGDGVLGSEVEDVVLEDGGVACFVDGNGHSVDFTQVLAVLRV